MTEKRSRPRLKVSMPVQVIGRGIDGEKFREICQTQDASAFGLCFTLQSIVSRGTILFLSMRMPRRLRLFDLAKDIYQVYAQVQRVQLLGQGGCEIGVSFIGRNPPPGYDSYQTSEYLNADFKNINVSNARIPNPGASTPLPPVSNQPKVTPVQAQPVPTTPIVPPPVASKPAAPRPAAPPAASSTNPLRKDERHRIPIDVSIEFLDASGKIVCKEAGLITNISKSGACVMSTREAQIGDRIRVEMTREDFAVQATVRAITTGQGGVCNLHVAFLDKCWMGGS
jgi:hypothetical protein